MTTHPAPSFELQPYFIPQPAEYDLIKELLKPKDRFHTYRTRSCANIRERIKVDSPAYDEEFVGTDKLKAKSKLATDIEESYLSELYHERSRTKYCSQPISDRDQLRESLRKKMDVYWIKEKLILEHVQSLKDAASIEHLTNQVMEYEDFVNVFKEANFRRMEKMTQEVKAHYEETDRLRNLREVLEVKVEPLKMNIFILGMEFVRRMILQKFQYLMNPIEWRKENDHLHRTPDGEIESLKDSIANRETSNLWNRKNDTVNTIKDFIENVYLKKDEPVVPVFSNGDEFLKAFKELRTNLVRFLSQFHYQVHALNDVEKEFVTFQQNNGVEQLDKLVQILSRRRVFMESRSLKMQEITRTTIDLPLKTSCSDEKLHNLRGQCEVIFENIVLKSSDASKNRLSSSVDKIAAVEKKALELLAIMDRIPAGLISQIDKDNRNERKKNLREAQRAVKIETSVHLQISQLQRSLAKPPRKEKREGKLPISKLPPKPIKPKILKPLLTPVEEAYYRAFTELGSVDVEIKFDKNIKRWIERIKNESVPFYLDHYLDVNLGVKLPKETPEEAEKIFLEEAASFKFKDLLPDVRLKVRQWEESQEQLKQENIRKTPYLYQSKS